MLMVVLFFAANFEFFWKHARFTKLALAPESSYTQNPAATSSSASVIDIPSLHISAPIVFVEGTSEAVFQKALKDGVVHYPGTALPGQLGTCYIFGHSSDYFWSGGKYKTVFALLPKIQTGETILLTYGEKVYTYTVTETKIVKTNDTQYLEQTDKSKPRLVVQTSYPVGTALKRFLVFAEFK